MSPRGLLVSEAPWRPEGHQGGGGSSLGYFFPSFGAIVMFNVDENEISEHYRQSWSPEIPKIGAADMDTRRTRNISHRVLVEQVLANQVAPFSRRRFECCTREMNPNIKSNIKLQSESLMTGSIYSTPISMVMWFYSYCLSNPKFSSDEPWSRSRTVPDCSIVGLWPSLLMS